MLELSLPASRSGAATGAPPAPATNLHPISLAGRGFAQRGLPWTLHGITYGTFAPRRGDGARFPDGERLAADFAAIAAHGFNTVRTYTVPPGDVVEVAAAAGLRLLCGLHTDDLRSLVGLSRRAQRRHLTAAVRDVREQVRSLHGADNVLAVSVGNELPADVVRWFGRARAEHWIERLVDAVRDEDDSCLVTYGNFPSTEFLELPSLDFAMFNVFLDDPVDLRRYLTRLHHVTGDRPLVIGELGFHVDGAADGEQAQAARLDAQLAVAQDRGVAGSIVFSWTDEWTVADHDITEWHFGLTTAGREKRPALDVAERWNRSTVADLDVSWPSVSVVVCAYNEARTIGECLAAATRLDYPDYEVIVVDDGSTDATAEIAGEYPTVRTLTVAHQGLGVARNAGLDAARGEIIAYLDADAYPTKEWLRYLVLAFDDDTVGAAGGPNLPPRDDPSTSRAVELAPGGPAHVLLGDDRAEHVPGCNMAFRREVLIEVGAFDPVYRAAGDDVDVCWKVLDRGWEIGFHPAAVVWHHRRGSIRAYLRQQRGYGRAEALVAARHPDRFGRTGNARWKGHIYAADGGRQSGQRIYRGQLGAAAYQSIYGGSHAVDTVHQLGVPAALLAGTLGVPLALELDRLLWLVPFAVTAFIVGVFMFDVGRATRLPRAIHTWRFAAKVAALHLLQPLARWWGRARNWQAAQRDTTPEPLPGPVSRGNDGVLYLPATDSRPQITRRLLATLRRAGYSVGSTTGWEDHDGSIGGSLLVRGRLVTSHHPEHVVQVRVRRRLRLVAVALIAAVVALLLHDGRSQVADVMCFMVATDLWLGAWRLGPQLRRVVVDAAKEGA